MTIAYPIKLKSSNRFIDELYGCEYGRYEDALGHRFDDLKAQGRTDLHWNDREVADHREAEYGVVFVDFYDRYKTLIEVRTDDELTELYYALASGTIGLYACTAANNLMDKIRDRVREIAPDLVRQWPYQNGM